MPNGKRRMGLSPETSESLDPAARRRVQNRLNQRASRARKRERARGQRRDVPSEAVMAEEICVETSATESSAMDTSPSKVSKATQTTSSDAGENSTIASWIMVPQSTGDAAGLNPHDPVASDPSFADQLLYPELGFGDLFQSQEVDEWETDFPMADQQPTQQTTKRGECMVSPTQPMPQWAPLSLETQTNPVWSSLDFELPSPGSGFLDLHDFDITMMDALPAAPGPEEPRNPVNEDEHKVTERITGMEVDGWIAWIASFHPGDLLSVIPRHDNCEEESLLKLLAEGEVDFSQAVRLLIS